MDQIPITFTHNNKQYSGILSEVMGAGSTEVWHLMIDDYYYGRLRIANGKFVFDSNRGMEDIVDQLEGYVISWYG